MTLTPHFIPTDQPSRIHIEAGDNYYFLSEKSCKPPMCENYQILLTSDEPPKVAQHYFSENKIWIRQNTVKDGIYRGQRTIIAAYPPIQGIPNITDEDIAYCIKVYGEGVSEVEAENEYCNHGFWDDCNCDKTLMVKDGFIQLIRPQDKLIYVDKLDDLSGVLGEMLKPNNKPLCTCRDDMKQRPICPVCDKEEFETNKNCLSEMKTSKSIIPKTKEDVEYKIFEIFNREFGLISKSRAKKIVLEILEYSKPSRPEPLFTKEDMEAAMPTCTKYAFDDLEQRLTELMADFLDEENTIMQEAFGNLKDPYSRKKSELHIKMAKAAMNAYKDEILIDGQRMANHPSAQITT